MTAHPPPLSDPPAGRRPRVRLRIGTVWIDVLTFDQAIEQVRQLVRLGTGGSVFTPNVDHVVMAGRNRAFSDIYARASLSLADGMPIVWASRILRPALPDKVSGSDLVEPLARLAASEGWRVYLLGGSTGAAAIAAERMRARFGTVVVGVDDSIIRIGDTSDAQRAIVGRVRAAKPHLVFVALGAPKQEFWIDEHLPELHPAVAVGVGASLDFLAGTMQRAPRWMSRMGLEWLFRLAQEPRRLWRRYLIDDPTFLWIVVRTAVERRRGG